MQIALDKQFFIRRVVGRQKDYILYMVNLLERDELIF
jgi:hypothetical protein